VRLADNEFTTENDAMRYNTMMRI